MHILRTAKGSGELRARARGLDLRARSLLFLADGRRPLSVLEEQFGADAGAIIERLMAQGYLLALPAGQQPATAAVLPSAPATPTAPDAAEPQGRSTTLAAARMYLFDQSERFFVRSSPQQARAWRERLREARDLDTMLDVGHALLDAVAERAGAERADAVRLQLYAMLPAQALATWSERI